MPQIHQESESAARIRVVGVGGSGGNAINHMIASKVKGVDFLVINTDAQDLQKSLAKAKIHIGKNLTRGLGAGMNPELGKRAAEETQAEIQDSLRGSDMVFIACGEGGGTGTGSAPVVARIARDLGALTVAVVTKPFSFEGQQRMRLAESGLEELRKEVDALIVIPNDRLLAVVDQNTTVKSAFAMCDEVLRQAVEGVSDLITTPGSINLDFADIKAVMEDAGSALMGVGVAAGDKRAEEAARLAINSPLLDISINGAKGVLLSIAGGEDLGLLEVQAAAQIVTETIDKNAKVIFGTSKDERLKRGEIRVTVIATGFSDEPGGSRGAPLFQMGAGKKERREATVEEERSGRIYNTVLPSDEVTEKTSPEESSKKTTPKASDEDDDWGAVPAFLRRSRKNQE
ncbi:MAG: cell division protein FtsZ [Patescibacteria group bacterium]